MKISKTKQNQREKLAFVYKCGKIEKNFEKGLAKGRRGMVLYLSAKRRAKE